MIGRMAKKRNEDRHKGEAVQVRMPAAMKEILRRHAASEERSTTQMAYLAIRDYLTRKGLWPPPDQQPPGADG